VHYWTHRLAGGGGAELVPHAAIIAAVYKDNGREVVDLTAFPPGLDPVAYVSVAYSEEPQYAHWSWPARVDPGPP
jgi:hypothetical protein